MINSSPLQQQQQQQQQHTTSPATTSARLKLYTSLTSNSAWWSKKRQPSLVRVLSVLTELELYARTRPSHITEIQISFSSRSTRTSPTTIKQSKSSSQQRSLQSPGSFLWLNKTTSNIRDSHWKWLLGLWSLPSSLAHRNRPSVPAVIDSQHPPLATIGKQGTFTKEKVFVYRIQVTWFCVIA